CVRGNIGRVGTDLSLNRAQLICSYDILATDLQAGQAGNAAAASETDIPARRGEFDRVADLIDHDIRHCASHEQGPRGYGGEPARFDSIYAAGRTLSFRFHILRDRDESTRVLAIYSLVRPVHGYSFKWVYTN